MSVPDYGEVITLVPQSGIQFLDFCLDLAGLASLDHAFLEEGAEGGERMLTPLRRRDGAFFHPATGKRVAEPTYRPSVQRALEPFLAGWVPIPFMRILGPDADGRDVLEQGPSNWARAHVVPEDGAAGSRYRLVLAFDTELDWSAPAKGRPYLMPRRDDAAREESFAFSAETDDVLWFVGEAWVDQWIEEMFRDAERRHGQNLRPEDRPEQLEHIARYLAFLALLQLGCKFPVIRLLDTLSAGRSRLPVPVDLVIDVGSSRTCGILIESDGDDEGRPDLDKSAALSLRDLSRPTESHASPFESRVEFARASFGKDAVSRLSGRANAFHWPSLARVGPEAVRFGAGGAGTQGLTGLSSPKRYLWDERPLPQLWRFRTPDGKDAPEPQVSGPEMAFVTESGEVLRQVGRGGAAIRPRFAKSALLTFMAAEILVQAIAGINSVNSRVERRHKDRPRRLRRIVMTAPPAMPLAERRILRERVEGAVALAWDALGWTEARSAPPQPSVEIAFDDATCTQLVYLYAEITEKLRGNPADLFHILGKPAATPGEPPKLRIASIDIGGAATHLAVVEYGAARQAITPEPLFRESFKVAGDDILQAVVGRHVIPSIEAYLRAKGLPDAYAVLHAIVGADRGNQSEPERQFRRRFVTQLCVPAALAVLRDYEAALPFAEEAPRTRDLRSLVGEAAFCAAVGELEQILARVGLGAIDILAATVAIDADELGTTIHGVISPVIGLLSEVVHHYGCDVVLLSGRPSRLPILLDLIPSSLPARPDRIIPMHQYPVGPWYPFRDRTNCIEDPKTTVAVGALLGTLAEARSDGFVLDRSRLAAESTARFVGVMDQSGRVPKTGVLFADVDDGGRNAAARLRDYLPVTLGFRQLEIERWPASPLYRLEYADHANAPRLKKPLTVTIAHSATGAADPGAPDEFRVAEVVDAQGTALGPSEVALRLQTVASSLGHWLDTGVVETY
jgi:hypothetical protein